MTAALNYEGFRDRRSTNLGAEASPLVKVLVIENHAGAEPIVANLGLSPDPQPSAPPLKWLLNAPLDYLLSCGGVVWFLFGIHYFLLSGAHSGALAATLISTSAVGALFLGEGHTAATLVRAHGEHVANRYFGAWLRPLSGLFVFLAILGIVVPAATPILAKLYLLLVPHHFVSQSYGIAKLYCLKQKYVMSEHEDTALRMVMQMTIAYGVIKQLTDPRWSGKTFLGQPIPFWGPVPEPVLQMVQILLAGSIAYLLFAVSASYVRERRLMPIATLLTTATSIGAFTMTQSANGIYWLYVSAFFHATQYLMVCVSSCMSDAGGLDKAKFASGPIETLMENSPATRFLGLSILLSVFIYIGCPRILEQFGVNFSVATVSIFATINLYHYVLDAVMWKLRRPEVRASLLSE